MHGRIREIKRHVEKIVNLIDFYGAREDQF